MSHVWHDSWVMCDMTRDPHKDACDWQDWGLTLEALPTGAGEAVQDVLKRTRGEREGGVEIKTHKSIWINKAWWTLSLPQTSRANPVQCYSTHQEKYGGCMHNAIGYIMACNVTHESCVTWLMSHVWHDSWVMCDMTHCIWDITHEGRSATLSAI